MQKVDAHIHYNGDHPDCIRVLERLDLKLLNVCVAHDTSGQWRSRAKMYRQLSEEHPARYAWCTTFDPPAFDDPDYVDRVLDGLDRDFAVGCKIWKNIGMAIRKPSGDLLMPNDPLFDPIYEHLAQSGKTLLMHIGEPLACWQRLDEDDPHYRYYNSHPEWYMYDKPDFPAHQELIDARDQVLAKHPKLRVVGAHLGSLEYDVGEIARRLDRYPNFAVDTSARSKDLGYQDAEVVRQFFLQYQDRILFGTDMVQREAQSSVAESARESSLQVIQDRYRAEFAYFESHHKVVIRGREVQGLGLPQTVLAKFYYINASRWYPGL